MLSHPDTSAFAVRTLRRWWQTVGSDRYRGADGLLICADGGGSNQYRVRAWKIELAKFAAETCLTVTACHLPRGTSKMEQDRTPTVLPDHPELARPTPDHPSGHRRADRRHHQHRAHVHCVLDTEQYLTGITHHSHDVDSLPITRHDFHGEWNYSLPPPTRRNQLDMDFAHSLLAGLMFAHRVRLLTWLLVLL